MEFQLYYFFNLIYNFIKFMYLNIFDLNLIQILFMYSNYFISLNYFGLYFKI